jgi:ribosomal protein S18 acetylase RimI-like enzyme
VTGAATDPTSVAPDGGHPLDNVVWHALTTRHAAHAEGRGAARRYRPDVSVFWAVRDLDPASWAALAALAAPGDQVRLFRAELSAPPPGWAVDLTGVGHQLVLDGDVADVAVPDGTRPLGHADVAAMLALVALTAPGPFAARTVELGGYLGVFEGGRLLAMAGRRMAVPGFTEVSAVCTHPDARRRGYAAALTAQVARGIVADGDTPFLHVVEGNPARRVYEQLGFAVRRQVGFTALRPPVVP